MNRYGAPGPSFPDLTQVPGPVGWSARNGHRVTEFSVRGLLQPGGFDWQRQEHDMNAALTAAKADNGSQESLLRLNDELLGLSMYRANVHPHLTARVTLPSLAAGQFRDGTLQNECNGYARMMAVRAGIAEPTTESMTFDITVPAPSYEQAFRGSQPSAYVSHARRGEQELLELMLTPDPATRRGTETHPFFIPLAYVDSFRVDAKEVTPITPAVNFDNLEPEEWEGLARKVIKL